MTAGTADAGRGQRPNAGRNPDRRGQRDHADGLWKQWPPNGSWHLQPAPLAHSSRQSHDTASQRRLWTISEELTGVTFPV